MEKKEENFYKILKKYNLVLLEPYKGFEDSIIVKNDKYKYKILPKTLVTHDKESIEKVKEYLQRRIEFSGRYPHLMKYVKNYEDVENVYTSSDLKDKKLELECPICHQYYNTFKYNSFTNHGFKFVCKFCNNKDSFFNRFGACLFKELGIPFKSEVIFDWCKFKDYKENRIRSGRYDFLIYKNVLVEMDGGFHFTDDTRKGQSLEESKYIDKMKNELAIKNGFEIIRINCDYKRFDLRYETFIKNLKESDLNKYIDFSKVDLDRINEKSQSSDYLEVIKLWNMGYDSVYISKELNLSYYETLSYLKVASKAKTINYSTKENKSRSYGTKIKVTQNGNFVGCFKSIPIASKELENMFNCTFCQVQIEKALNKKLLIYHSFTFEKISMDEYLSLKDNKMSNCIDKILINSISRTHKQKAVLCIDNDLCFDSPITLENVSENIFGQKIGRESVKNVCNKVQTKTRGYSFKYIEKIEFNQRFLNDRTKCYGKYFSDIAS